ncbi:hypothetical protein D5086_025525 [Populus alba]|uniref:Uncharacterized protein n=2 Tax=Populus alba TaxID=43335 RepID=A0ACC4AZ93_POPAL
MPFHLCKAIHRHCRGRWATPAHEADEEVFPSGPLSRRLHPPPIHPTALDSHRQPGRVSHLKESGEISDTCQSATEDQMEMMMMIDKFPEFYGACNDVADHLSPTDQFLAASSLERAQANRPTATTGIGFPVAMTSGSYLPVGKGYHQQPANHHHLQNVQHYGDA